MNKLILSLFLAVFLIGLVSAENIYVNYSTGDDGTILAATPSAAAQTFTLDNAINLTGFEVKIYRDGSPATGGIMLMYTNATGFPNNSIITYQTFNADALTTDTNGAWYRYNLTGILNSGTYALVLNASLTGASNDILWRTDKTSPTYTGGNVYTTSTVPYNNWDNFTGYDAMIKVYGFSPVTLVAPPDSSLISNTTTSFRSTVGGATINATIYIWDEDNNIINQTTNTLPGTTSLTEWNMTFADVGVYHWNVLGCIGTDCVWADENQTFSYGFSINSETYNSTSYDTATENYQLNITLAEGVVLSSATLVYDDVSYDGTISTSGDNKIITRELDLSSVGSKVFHWNLVIDGETLSTTNQTQTVSSISLGLCNATLTTPFVNFTFADETTLSKLNATISGGILEYYLGDGTITKTYSLTETTAQDSYALCVSPTDQTIKIDSYLPYAFTGYPQRVYNPIALDFTNVTTNKTLYLLSSADGIYTTFQVINAAEQPLEDVYVNLTRTINGEVSVLGSGYTGASGTITFWQNPDQQYTANFLLAPYPFYTVTQAFTNTEYTITLGAISDANVTDYTKGISYTVLPSLFSLNNDTIYNFNFSITSSYWALEGYGFNITDANGSLIGSSSASNPGGSLLSLSLDTASNETFYLTYHWIVNSTETSAARQYIIINYGNNGYSLAVLLERFKGYVDSGGPFGITDFGVGILCFLIILGVTGTLRIKSRITDETTLMGVVFALVAFFDISLGLIPNPIGAVDNFPTIFIGLIFVGFMFKEVFR